MRPPTDETLTMTPLCCVPPAVPLTSIVQCFQPDQQLLFLSGHRETGGKLGFRQDVDLFRKAELELEGKYRPAEHDEYLRYRNWQGFTDEDGELCTPVVAVGGETLAAGVDPRLEALRTAPVAAS